MSENSSGGSSGDANGNGIPDALEDLAEQSGIEVDELPENFGSDYINRYDDLKDTYDRSTSSGQKNIDDIASVLNISSTLVTDDVIALFHYAHHGSKPSEGRVLVAEEAASTAPAAAPAASSPESIVQVQTQNLELGQIDPNNQFNGESLYSNNQEVRDYFNITTEEGRTHRREAADLMNYEENFNVSSLTSEQLGDAYHVMNQNQREATPQETVEMPEAIQTSAAHTAIAQGPTTQTTLEIANEPSSMTVWDPVRNATASYLSEYSDIRAITDNAQVRSAVARDLGMSLQDVNGAYVAIWHYLKNGEDEHREASSEMIDYANDLRDVFMYNTEGAGAYLRNNPDVQAAANNPAVLNEIARLLDVDVAAVKEADVAMWHYVYKPEGDVRPAGSSMREEVEEFKIRIENAKATTVTAATSTAGTSTAAEEPTATTQPTTAQSETTSSGPESADEAEDARESSSDYFDRYPDVAQVFNANTAAGLANLQQIANYYGMPPGYDVSLLTDDMLAYAHYRMFGGSEGRTLGETSVSDVLKQRFNNNYTLGADDYLESLSENLKNQVFSEDTKKIAAELFEIEVSEVTNEHLAYMSIRLHDSPLRNRYAGTTLDLAEIQIFQQNLVSLTNQVQQEVPEVVGQAGHAGLDYLQNNPDVQTAFDANTETGLAARRVLANYFGLPSDADLKVTLTDEMIGWAHYVLNGLYEGRQMASDAVSIDSQLKSTFLKNISDESGVNKYISEHPEVMALKNDAGAMAQIAQAFGKDIIQVNSEDIAYWHYFTTGQEEKYQIGERMQKSLPAYASIYGYNVEGAGAYFQRYPDVAALLDNPQIRSLVSAHLGMALDEISSIHVAAYHYITSGQNEGREIGVMLQQQVNYLRPKIEMSLSGPPEKGFFGVGDSGNTGQSSSYGAEMLPAEVVERAESSTHGHYLLASSEDVTTLREHLDENRRYRLDVQRSGGGESGDSYNVQEFVTEAEFVQALTKKGMSPAEIQKLQSENEVYLKTEVREHGDGGDLTFQVPYDRSTYIRDVLKLPDNFSLDKPISFNGSWVAEGDASFLESSQDNQYALGAWISHPAYPAIADDDLAKDWVQIGDNGPLGDDILKMLDSIYKSQGVTTEAGKEIVKGQLFKYDERFGILASKDFIESAIEMNENRKQGFFEKPVGRAIIMALAAWAGGSTIVIGGQGAGAAAAVGSTGLSVTAGAGGSTIVIGQGAAAAAVGSTGLSVTAGALTSAAVSFGTSLYDGSSFLDALKGSAISLVAASAAQTLSSHINNYLINQGFLGYIDEAASVLLSTTDKAIMSGIQGSLNNAISQFLSTGKIDLSAVAAGGFTSGLTAALTINYTESDFVKQLAKDLGVSPASLGATFASMTVNATKGNVAGLVGDLAGGGLGALGSNASSDVRLSTASVDLEDGIRGDDWESQNQQALGAYNDRAPVQLVQSNATTESGATQITLSRGTETYSIDVDPVTGNFISGKLILLDGSESEITNSNVLTYLQMASSSPDGSADPVVITERDDYGNTSAHISILQGGQFQQVTIVYDEKGEAIGGTVSAINGSSQTLDLAAVAAFAPIVQNATNSNARANPDSSGATNQQNLPQVEAGVTQYAVGLTSNFDVPTGETPPLTAPGAIAAATELHNLAQNPPPGTNVEIKMQGEKVVYAVTNADGLAEYVIGFDGQVVQVRTHVLQEDGSIQIVQSDLVLNSKTISVINTNNVRIENGFRSAGQLYEESSSGDLKMSKQLSSEFLFTENGGKGNFEEVNSRGESKSASVEMDLSNEITPIKITIGYDNGKKETYFLTLEQYVDFLKQSGVTNIGGTFGSGYVDPDTSNIQNPVAPGTNEANYFKFSNPEDSGSNTILPPTAVPPPTPTTAPTDGISTREFFEDGSSKVTYANGGSVIFDSSGKLAPGQATPYVFDDGSSIVKFADGSEMTFDSEGKPYAGSMPMYSGGKLDVNEGVTTVTTPTGDAFKYSETGAMLGGTLANGNTLTIANGAQVVTNPNGDLVSYVSPDNTVRISTEGGSRIISTPDQVILEKDNGDILNFSADGKNLTSATFANGNKLSIEHGAQVVRNPDGSLVSFVSPDGNTKVLIQDGKTITETPTMRVVNNGTMVSETDLTTNRTVVKNATGQVMYVQGGSFGDAFAEAKRSGSATFAWTGSQNGSAKFYNTVTKEEIVRANGGNIQEYRDFVKSNGGVETANSVQGYFQRVNDSYANEAQRMQARGAEVLSAGNNQIGSANLPTAASSAYASVSEYERLKNNMANLPEEQRTAALAASYRALVSQTNSMEQVALSRAHQQTQAPPPSFRQIENQNYGGRYNTVDVLSADGLLNLAGNVNELLKFGALSTPAGWIYRQLNPEANQAYQQNTAAVSQAYNAGVNALLNTSPSQIASAAIDGVSSYGRSVLTRYNANIDNPTYSLVGMVAGDIADALVVNPLKSAFGTLAQPDIGVVRTAGAVATLGLTAADFVSIGGTRAATTAVHGAAGSLLPSKAVQSLPTGSSPIAGTLDSVTPGNFSSGIVLRNGDLVLPGNFITQVTPPSSVAGNLTNFAPGAIGYIPPTNSGNLADYMNLASFGSTSLSKFTDIVPTVNLDEAKSILAGPNGQFDNNIPAPTSPYAYHGTAAINHQSVMTNGLNSSLSPNAINGGTNLNGVNYATDLGSVTDYAQNAARATGSEPIIYRWPLETPQSIDFIGATNAPIAPSKIEFSLDNGSTWQSLSINNTTHSHAARVEDLVSASGVSSVVDPEFARVIVGGGAAELVTLAPAAVQKIESTLSAKLGSCSLATNEIIDFFPDGVRVGESSTHFHIRLSDGTIVDPTFKQFFNVAEDSGMLFVGSREEMIHELTRQWNESGVRSIFKGVFTDPTDMYNKVWGRFDTQFGG